MPTKTTSVAFDARTLRAFRGRVYGVTGGAHGIGEATVRQLLSLGARVALLDINKEDLKRVKADLAGAGARLLCFHGDVADQAFQARAVRAIYRRWKRIDGWVNNAMDNPGRSLDGEEPETFERAWRVNTLAAWQACKLVAPIMERCGGSGRSGGSAGGTGGSIVNLSSMLARMTYRNSSAYVSSKLATEGLTRALAVDLGPRRVRVNAVVPGAIATARARPLEELPQARDVPRADLERWWELRQSFRHYQSVLLQPWPDRGQPDQVAAVIVFLLSDAASFITGASIPVDGGATVMQPALMGLPLKDMAAAQEELRALGQKHARLWVKHFGKRPKR